MLFTTYLEKAFWAALTPLNFHSIALNRGSSPHEKCLREAFFKPFDSASYPAYLIYRVFREVGLPAGVFSFVSGSKIRRNVDRANKCEDMKLVTSGAYDDSDRYYDQLTIDETTDQENKIMECMLYTFITLARWRKLRPTQSSTGCKSNYREAVKSSHSELQKKKGDIFGPFGGVSGDKEIDETPNQAATI
ncbi:hypothetical protein Aperf_G00000037146 [Anoplocephala perfoliata]